MKNGFLIGTVVIALTFTGCIKQYDESQSTDSFTGSKSEIEEYFNPEIVKALEDLGYTFNTGGNPPSIVGDYLFSTMTLLNSTVDSDYIGQTFLDQYLNFSNQNGKNVMYSSSSSISSGNGSASFVSGNGNKFSIYAKVKGTLQGYNGTFAVAISGEISSAGIQDILFANLMLDNQGNPGGVWIPNNTGRLVEDSDGLASRQ